MPVCVEDGQSTGCSRSNGFGTCGGVRTCALGTLSACSAKEPVSEACNGQDDDCDAQTDEGFPDYDDDTNPDCTDPDDDNDGVGDAVDNCPLEPNSDQVDRDGDKLGDSCDPDIDGDGVPNASDCAPLDPNTAGGQAEACNGKDDDCDGQTDEASAIGCKNYFPDQDSDSFGATPLALCLCGPTAARPVSVPGDCNDADPFSNPAAPEVCDGADNNCDALKDEEGALGCLAFRYDNDGDTYYGPTAVERCLCSAIAADKFTGLSSGDCNDNDFAIRPNALEKCDGGDQNCNLAIDEGCDDDGDGYCDTALTYELTGQATCFFGPGDCDDDTFAVNPGKPELCDGLDTNCDPSDDLAEGTILACGPSCSPCPKPPGGSQYYCSGVGPDASCQIECAGGKFCADCTCDGTALLQLGGATQDARVLYDGKLDTFRVAYFNQGDFRLRAIGPTGSNGNDVVAVSNVTKWTRWDVTQNPASGEFVFAWTAYPDSAVRVGVAGETGSAITQSVAAPDLAGGAQFRENVTIAWSPTTDTYLTLWDETTSFGLDVRGLLLGKAVNAFGVPFDVIGGSGDQVGPRLRLRSAGQGYAVGLASNKPGVTGLRPEVRFIDHSANTLELHTLEPDVKSGTTIELWWDAKVDRGVVQWLSNDDQYKTTVISEEGPVGPSILGGAPVATACGAPKQNGMRLVFASQGGLRSRVIDANTGLLGPIELQLAADGSVTSVVGSVTHPLGYALVLWNTADGLRGRLVAP